MTVSVNNNGLFNVNNTMAGLFDYPVEACKFCSSLNPIVLATLYIQVAMDF